MNETSHFSQHFITNSANFIWSRIYKTIKNGNKTTQLKFLQMEDGCCDHKSSGNELNDQSIGIKHKTRPTESKFMYTLSFHSSLCASLLFKVTLVFPHIVKYH